MCSFKSIYFVIFILNLYGTYAQISDKRLCVDPQCKEPVSLARTLLRYSSPDPRILSFAPNVPVKIYSKEAGSEASLWGAEINGIRGYIPRRMVREQKVYKTPKLLVDTELKQGSQVPKEADQKIDPNNVEKPYEVVDGTTIYLNPQDSVNPSSTESPVLSTSLPTDNNATEQQTVPVDESKEKIVPKGINEQKSVVENVLSSFSNFMDDEDSEEIDAEDDEEDDEDEEDEEESAEAEANTDTMSGEDNKKVGQDINSLHNLPAGVKVSSYSLEIEQPLNGTIDMNKEEDSERASVDSKPPVPLSSSDKGQEPDTLHEDDKISETVVPPVSDKEVPAVVETEEKSAAPKTEQLQSDKLESGTTVPKEAKPENPVEGNEQPKSETDQSVHTNSENTDIPVTEPSTMEEEEPLPIIDDVTTSNPLEMEQESVKPEEVAANVSPQETEEEKNMEMESSTASSDIDPKAALEESTTLVPEPAPISEPSPSVNDVDNQNLTAEEPLKEATTLVPETIPISEPLPPDNVEENQNPKVEEPLKESSTLAPETVSISKPSPPDNPVENQNPTAEEKSSSFVRFPPLGLFSPTKNEVHEENKGTENINVSEDVINNSDTTERQEDVDPISPETTGEVPEDTLNQVPDTSEDDQYNAAEDQIENNQVPEEATSDFEQDTVNTDEEVNKEEQSEEGINSDTKEGPQSDDTSNFAEIPQQEPTEEVSEESGGMWSGIFSFFGGGSDQSVSSNPNEYPVTENTIEENVWVPEHKEEAATEEHYCKGTSESCNTSDREPTANLDGIFDNITMKFSSDFFLLLITTAGSVIVFLFVYMALDRHKREAPLVARINKLEKELLVTLKENELLQEKGTSSVQEIESVPNELVEQLTQKLAEAQFSQHASEEKIVDLEKQLEAKGVLEEQVESLEKELEISTEVGMELNRIISEMLDPTNGSDKLKENMEQLQRQLLEQKDVINSINETLREKESENRTLRGDLERSKKAAVHLQTKVEDLVEKILKIEKEKDQQQLSLQNEITIYQQKYNESVSREEILNNDNQIIRLQLSEAQRQVDIKTKEYQTLKESLDKLKPLKNNSEALKALLDATSIRAEIQQLKSENAAYAAQLQQEQAVKVGFEKKYQAIVEEINSLTQKYEQADKEKLEVNSKLEVLNNYFKKRESELQEEIIRYKSIWDAKEGEATSTTERMRYMQEEIENYKAQNETLKQEIISQEIDLKSQISVLEKKVHENWVTARQTERKLEDARQEAGQLRNRLTLRERAINEERIQIRLQSPVEPNGELTLSPHPIDSPASPPLLYGARDHITKSPPLSGLPPHFLPPPGAPFMPPPLHGMPPFMPPPPSMFPGDHRPPPLGRMSSPPLNSRYSPDTSAFSPYDRNSPSPPYDSEYGASPPPMRGYSPYNSRDDRRDYKRPPHARTNGRNGKGAVMSSGSDHSNDSIDKVNRKQSKMV